MTDYADIGIKVDTRQVDQGSAALDRFNQAGQQASRSAQAVTQSTNALGTAQQRTAQRTTGLSATQQRLARTSQEAAGAGDALGATAQRLERQFLSLKRVLVTLGIAFTIREFIELADTMRRMEGQLRLVTSGSEDLLRTQRALFEIAQRTRSGYEDTVQLYARIARSSKELGASQAALLRVTELVNKTVQISNATTTEASAGIIQFSQALASGTLRGDELRSVMEQLPRLAQAIANGMGKTIGELRKMGEDGQLTADKVLSALIKQGKLIDAEFAKLPKTVGQAMTQIRNQIGQFVGTLSNAGFLDALVAQIDRLREAMSTPEFQQAARDIGEFLAGAVRVAADAIAFLVRNFELLKAVAVAFVTIKIAQFFVGATAAMVAFHATMVRGIAVMGLYRAAMLGTAASMGLATKALYVLRAAFLANPFGIILAVVTALVLALMQLSDVLNVNAKKMEEVNRASGRLYELERDLIDANKDQAKQILDKADAEATFNLIKAESIRQQIASINLFIQENKFLNSFLETAKAIALLNPATRSIAQLIPTPREYAVDLEKIAGEYDKNVQRAYKIIEAARKRIEGNDSFTFSVRRARTKEEEALAKAIAKTMTTIEAETKALDLEAEALTKSGTERRALQQQAEAEYILRRKGVDLKTQEGRETLSVVQALLAERDAARDLVKTRKEELNLRNEIADVKAQRSTLGLSERDAEIELRLQRAILKAQAEGRELTADQLKLRKELIATLVDEERALEAQKKFLDDIKKAWEDLYRGISDEFTSVFRQMLDGGVDDWDDFLNKLESLLKDWVARMVQVQIFEPLLNSLFSGLGFPGGGSIGIGGGLLNPQAVTSTFLGSGDSLFGNVGRWLGLGGSASGFAPSGAATGSFRSAQEAGLSGGQVYSGLNPGGLTFSSALGAGAQGALLGFGTSSLVGALGLGGVPGTTSATVSQIGGTAGGAAGAIVGSIIPGVGTLLGGLVGSLAGSVLGGLFGNRRPSVGPNSNAALKLDASGNVVIEDIGADNGGSRADARTLGDAFAKAINNLSDALGAPVNAIGGVGIRINKNGFEGTIGNKVLASGKDAQQVIEQTLFTLLKNRDDIFGLSERDRTAVTNSSATDIQGLLNDIEFVRNLEKITADLEAATNEFTRIQREAYNTAQSQIDSLLEFVQRATDLGFADEGAAALKSITDSMLELAGSREPLSETEQALAALAGQFEALRDNAEALNLTLDQVNNAEAQALEQLRQGFDEGINQQILQIIDPLQAALEAEAVLASQRLADAERIGGNIIAVEQLNALRRQQIVEQYAGATTASLQKFFEEITFGELSGAAPGNKLSGARDAFEQAANAALSGDATAKGRIEELGRQYLQYSRSYYASGSGFQSDLSYVQSVVGQLISGNDNFALTGSSTEAALIASTVASTSANTDSILEDQTAVIEELAATSDQAVQLQHEFPAEELKALVAKFIEKLETEGKIDLTLITQNGLIQALLDRMGELAVYVREQIEEIRRLAA